jgi:hypothetical protein
MRRCLAFLLVLLPLSAVPADALTVRDVIELSKANVGDEVLLALIDVERPVFTINADTLKQLKQSGVSDTVIIAMIRSGRQPVVPAPESAAPLQQPFDVQPMEQPPAEAPAPPVAEQPVEPAPPVAAVPVIVPVAVPVPMFMTGPAYRPEFVRHTIVTQDGNTVNVREPLPPNCTRAEPIYWGNDGKRRPGTWEPPVQVVCR